MRTASWAVALPVGAQDPTWAEEPSAMKPPPYGKNSIHSLLHRVCSAEPQKQVVLPESRRG
jgi:hypothetical protein